MPLIETTAEPAVRRDRCGCWFCFLLLCLPVHCTRATPSGSNEVPDAAADSGPEAGLRRDAGPVTGLDTGPDLRADAGLDAATRPAPDAGVDAGSQDGWDSGADAYADSGIDVGPSGHDAAIADTSATDTIACPGSVVTLTAIARNMIDEEYPTRVTTDRIHVRDDARTCGGMGVVRSLIRWDLTSLAGHTAGDGAVSLLYTYNFGYTDGPRLAGVHRVTSSWSSGTSWSDAPGWDATVLSTAAIPGTAGATVTFTIPATVLQGWIDSPQTNHGLVVKLVDETCPSPRLPAEFGVNPQLAVPCQ